MRALFSALIGACAFGAGLLGAGVLSAGCGDSCNNLEPRRCDPAPVEGSYNFALDGEQDCAGADVGACYQGGVLIAQDTEIVLRWTDADGVRWEASWAREDASL